MMISQRYNMIKNGKNRLIKTICQANSTLYLKAFFWHCLVKVARPSPQRISCFSANRLRPHTGRALRRMPIRPRCYPVFTISLTVGQLQTK